MPTTRQEHLQWAKERALQYVDAGELANAVASMGSDLGKHPELRSEPFLIAIGMMEIQRGTDAVRRWVEGFN